jgi:hypothetical protein
VVSIRRRAVLPEIGQDFGVEPELVHDRGVHHPELVEHVAATTGLPLPEASRVVEDVIAFLGESVAEYVRRRHAWLQSRGATNAEILPVIQRELRTRPFRAPELSERQIRRLVYG